MTETRGPVPPDPDPSSTAGLEPGSGVPPGETPPAEAGTSGLSHAEQPGGRFQTPVALIVIAAIVVLIVAVVIVGAIQLF